MWHTRSVRDPSRRRVDGPHRRGREEGRTREACLSEPIYLVAPSSRRSCAAEVRPFATAIFSGVFPPQRVPLWGQAAEVSALTEPPPASPPSASLGVYHAVGTFAGAQGVINPKKGLIRVPTKRFLESKAGTKRPLSEFVNQGGRQTVKWQVPPAIAQADSAISGKCIGLRFRVQV
jgi:hypothetical protein